VPLIYLLNCSALAKDIAYLNQLQIIVVKIGQDSKPVICVTIISWLAEQDNMIKIFHSYNMKD